MQRSGKHLKFTSTLLSVIWLASAASAAISLSQSVDRTEVPFEGAVNFEIKLTWEGSAFSYRFDQPFRLESDQFKVTKFSSSISSSGSGPDEITTKYFHYKLAPTLSGAGTIERMTIEYVIWPDSIVGELMTDPVSVIIAEPVRVDVTDEGGVSWLLIVVIVVIAAGIGVSIFLLRRRKSTKPVQTPVDEFLERLTILKQEAGQDLKKFQTGVYKYLVAYLSARYQLDLDGKSIDAILMELESTDLSPLGKEKIVAWLKKAEKEKFSPLKAAPGEVVRLESEIRSFFEQMR